VRRTTPGGRGLIIDHGEGCSTRGVRLQPDLSSSGLRWRIARQEVTVIRISSKSAWIVATLVAAVPAAVQAQAPPENAEAFRFPHLIVGFGVGSSSGPEGVTAGTLQTASVQYLLGRHFAVEAEGSRWATTWDDGTRRGWSGGGNLLYRSELRRVSR
jgi:hypothetical protein